jgi:hypothetical protein
VRVGIAGGGHTKKKSYLISSIGFLA